MAPRVVSGEGRCQGKWGGRVSVRSVASHSCRAGCCLSGGQHQHASGLWLGMNVGAGECVGYGCACGSGGYRVGISMHQAIHEG